MQNMGRYCSWISFFLVVFKNLLCQDICIISSQICAKEFLRLGSCYLQHVKNWAVFDPKQCIHFCYVSISSTLRKCGNAISEKCWSFIAIYYNKQLLKLPLGHIFSSKKKNEEMVCSFRTLAFLQSFLTNYGQIVFGSIKKLRMPHFSKPLLKPKPHPSSLAKSI